MSLKSYINIIHQLNKRNVKLEHVASFYQIWKLWCSHTINKTRFQYSQDYLVILPYFSFRKDNPSPFIDLVFSLLLLEWNTCIIIQFSILSNFHCDFFLRPVGLSKIYCLIYKHLGDFLVILILIPNLILWSESIFCDFNPLKFAEICSMA